MHWHLERIQRWRLVCQATVTLTAYESLTWEVRVEPRVQPGRINASQGPTSEACAQEWLGAQELQLQ